MCVLGMISMKRDSATQKAAVLLASEQVSDSGVGLEHHTVLGDGVCVCHPTRGSGAIGDAVAGEGKLFGVLDDNGERHAYSADSAFKLAPVSPGSDTSESLNDPFHGEDPLLCFIWRLSSSQDYADKPQVERQMSVATSIARERSGSSPEDIIGSTRHVLVCSAAAICKLPTLAVHRFPALVIPQDGLRRLCFDLLVQCTAFQRTQHCMHVCTLSHGHDAAYACIHMCIHLPVGCSGVHVAVLPSLPTRGNRSVLRKLCNSCLFP